MLSAVAIGDVDPEILDAEERLRAAQLGADVDALNQLIADELLFAGPDGRLATKEEDLAAHRSGFVRFRSHDPLELRSLRIGPDTIVTSLLTQIAVEVGGKSIRGQVRYTRVWARNPPGPWRVAAGHVSEASE